MKSVIIIPARFASTRFPGKPLTKLLKKEMIIWVAELCARAVGKDNVYVATDDKRIEDVVNQYGYDAIMTPGEALTGTDRVAMAAEQIEADIYINVQGDETLIEPSDILNIRDVKMKNMDMVVNGYCELLDSEVPDSVNLPKVVLNEKEELLYMSRSVVPGYKTKRDMPHSYLKQVCIYAFTLDELRLFKSFGRKSRVESNEDIEILRFLEFDKKIRMVQTSSVSLAVDVPEDVNIVEAELKRKRGEV